LRALRWLAGEAWERVNVAGLVKVLRDLRHRYGLRFAIAAGIWEFFESVVLPLLAWKVFHHPELAPIFVVVHFEPIIYPVLIYGFRTYDRIMKRVPWDPPRPFSSTSARSWLKVASHRLVSFGTFWLLLRHLGLPLWLLTAYLVVMTLFKYVHERIWHDSSWGITVDDQVLARRVVAKSVIYRLVSASVMSMGFSALLGATPWGHVVAYQLVNLGSCLLVEWGWAKSGWGIRPSVNKFVDTPYGT